jgi:excinuclease ABC subunit B
MSLAELTKMIQKLTKEMSSAAAELDFERAASLRDRIFELKAHVREIHEDSKKNK